MNVRTFMLAGVLLSAGLQVNAKSRFDFIDTKFDDFMLRVGMPENKQKEFKVFYVELMDRINQLPEKEKRIAYRELYDLGLNGMKSDHKDWYDTASQYLANAVDSLDKGMEPVREALRGFVTRYGVFEKYASRTKMAKSKTTSPSLWDSVKSYAHAFSDKMTSLFA